MLIRIVRFPIPYLAKTGLPKPRDLSFDYKGLFPFAIILLMAGFARAFMHREMRPNAGQQQSGHADIPP
ncbi:MAG: hypothetical protein QGI08_02605 [Paracoccaceae bacterium]|nr:hypothetical protein [Paracoccaceae bacterium]MDP7184591.1 hypothetical protein [Paracoccaceae bacterium]